LRDSPWLRYGAMGVPKMPMHGKVETRGEGRDDDLDEPI
jgi:hypothetical protein